MFFDKTSQGVIIRVRLSPNSSSCKANGFFQTPDDLTFIKINVISVPEKGKANQELINWFSKQLKIAKSQISIISGELDRYKKILITGEQQEIIAKLQNMLPKENI